MSKVKTLGFGFNPVDAEHHFLWERQTDKKRVLMYERFKWQDTDDQMVDHRFDKLKVIVDIEKWYSISSQVSDHFNDRLQAESKNKGNWRKNQTPLQVLLGKELTLLLWGIEDLDPGQIYMALKNWLGLRPEERWWLFTMTNAATGGVDDRRGWRKAIKYALAENPINEVKQQRKLIDLLR
jgi:hypothetical protein